MFFSVKMLRLCPVCVICNSNSFYSFIFLKTLHNDCLHIEDVHFLIFAHLIISYHTFRIVELRHYYVDTTSGLLTLCNL